MPKETLICHCPRCGVDSTYMIQDLIIEVNRIVEIEAMYDLNQYVARTEEDNPMFNMVNHNIELPEDQSTIKKTYESWYRCPNCRTMLQPIGSFLKVVEVEEESEEQ